MEETENSRRDTVDSNVISGQI